MIAGWPCRRSKPCKVNADFSTSMRALPKRAWRVWSSVLSGALPLVSRGTCFGVRALWHTTGTHRWARRRSLSVLWSTIQKILVQPCPASSRAFLSFCPCFTLFYPFCGCFSFIFQSIWRQYPVRRCTEILEPLSPQTMYHLSCWANTWWTSALCHIQRRRNSRWTRRALFANSWCRALMNSGREI